MNIPKKVKAILLAIVMLLSVGLNALGVSAAEPISPDAKGSITIHKFEEPDPDDELDLPVSDGQPIEDTDLVGLNPIDEIPFRITKVVPDSAGTIVVDGKNYSKDTEVSVTQTVETANGGIAVFGKQGDVSTLPIGIYLVEELSNDITFGRAPFLVSIPTTIEVNVGTDTEPELVQQHLFDIHVYPKNEMGTFKKDFIVPEQGTNVVTWQITSSIPHDIAEGKSFVITDTLDDRLQYVYDSTEGLSSGVTVGTGINSTTGAITGILDSSTYSVTYVDNKLTITFLPGTDNENFVALDAFDNLYIQFDTMIVMPTFDLEEDDFDWEKYWAKIYNSAELEYVNSQNETFNKNTPDDPTDPIDPPPGFDPYGIRIYKINNSDQPLAGAKFKIYDSVDLDNALVNPADGTTDWEVTSGTDGYAYIFGLVAGEYWLVETQVPSAEYNALTGPVHVTVDAAHIDVDLDGDGTDENVVGVIVINVPGFTLPITGGAGTLLFTLIGLLLIAAAIVIYTISKKRKEQHV